MVEGAQIDWGGHNNDLNYVITEFFDFDQAVGEAMKFADVNGETLVIVSSDHETGGLSLIGGDISKGYVHGQFNTTDHIGVMVPALHMGQVQNSLKVFIGTQKILENNGGIGFKGEREIDPAKP
jgi:alkaline phosphatase